MYGGSCLNRQHKISGLQKHFHRSLHFTLLWEGKGCVTLLASNRLPLYWIPWGVSTTTAWKQIDRILSYCQHTVHFCNIIGVSMHIHNIHYQNTFKYIYTIYVSAEFTNQKSIKGFCGLKINFANLLLVGFPYFVWQHG